MIFFKQISIFYWKTCFLSFSTQNHAESCRNFVKNSALDTKCAKLHQNSDFGHVRTCQGQSRRTSPCQPSRLSFFFFLRNYTFPLFINKFIIFFSTYVLFPNMRSIKGFLPLKERKKELPKVCSPSRLPVSVPIEFLPVPIAAQVGVQRYVRPQSYQSQFLWNSSQFL